MSMLSSPLEFELPLVALESQLSELKDQIAAGGDSKVLGEYARLETLVAKTSLDIYSNLTPFQRVQLSRHFDRPFSLDFIKYMCSDFIELHGDRLFGDDPAIVGGLADLAGVKVVVVGHQRGRTTQERLKRNFGMANPEGYRKALRLFRLAEKFKRPVINLIDTQGAYPGLEAEERGQAEAIARNLLELADLQVPVISVIIGEGGSGGALALGVADKVLMLENACYSVITPEGCAAILWKADADSAKNFSATAAEALKITASQLLELGVIEEVVSEPIGGAHRNHKESAEGLQASLLKHLDGFKEISVQEMLDQRYQRFRKLGPYQG